MATWQDFENELNIWHKNNEVASLWWRDDDAAQLTPQLKKLAHLSDAYSLPIHLATIPANINKDMVARVLQSQNLWVLQHGYSHKSYAPKGKGQGKWELGDHRPIQEVSIELKEGFNILSTAFNDQFIPIQVPPWTRVSHSVAAQLSAIGFKALSVEGPRKQCEFAKHIKIINPHCDPIKWKDNARFKGSEYTLGVLIHHLQSRRATGGDKREATGLCTHHLDHDEDLWHFLEELAQFSTHHQAVKWVCLKEQGG